MSRTNFAALDEDEKTVWSRDTYQQAREKSFVMKFVGTSQNSMIHRVTELTKTERGDSAVVTMVPDMNEHGITGDNQLEGNEASLTAHQDKILIDQLRQGVTNSGRMADQKTIVNFREQVKDQLSYWLADRMDQTAFLTMAGLDYGQENDGRVRKSQGSDNDNLSQLQFNAPLAATSERHVRVKADGSIVSGDTAAVAAGDTIGYDAIVNLQSELTTRYIRGIKADGGDEVHHFFLHPKAMAKLKLDQDFKENARNAGVRGEGNTLFKGGNTFIVDGLMIHSYRMVPTTLGQASGSKWGADGTVDGCYGLLCGAQAMGFIDLDTPIWEEDDFDYKNRVGISYGKIFGMKKLQFKDAKASADRSKKQDYGVIRVDMAI